MPEPLKISIVVGEESGDRLGAALMRELKRRAGGDLTFSGVGGEEMTKQGLVSLFPLTDIAVMGLGPVIGRLPTIIARVRATVQHVVGDPPDVLVIIDSPDFTHAVAKRVRRRNASIPIVDWVSPSVWAWRPGRAKKMAAYIDHVLAILPFEPEAHRRLDGPPCTYVGHPLIEQISQLRPAKGERVPLDEADPPILLVLPGSRRGEIDRLMDDYGKTIGHLKDFGTRFRLIIPALDHLVPEIEKKAANWVVDPEIVTGEVNRRAALRMAHAALATSGTITLELALSGVPMLVAYRLDWLARQFRFVIDTWTIILPNHIWGRPVLREFVDEYVRPEMMARGLRALLTNTPERRAQIEAFAELDDLMGAGAEAPARQACDIVLGLAQDRMGDDAHPAARGTGPGKPA